ncbi:MAG TPA: endonuclease/exonuclease/phosphatase family protein, partial [Paludibacteraceae bacterium]|nr:endonuclease/exonuclease/phosphatase family protein [Paludibacteraceae bacterium]
DEDVLVMGDMNAYAFEDPIQVFIQAGYKDMHRELHGDSAYSYVYRGEAGYLDHALASPSLANQITFVSAFHINADEPAMFEYSGSNYQGNMYRCSDHDPVVVGISLSSGADIDTLPSGKNVKIYPTIVKYTFTIKDAENFYLQIFSANGLKMYETQISSSVAEFDVRQLGLPAGAYVVRVLGNGTIGRQIILVK